MHKLVSLCVALAIGLAAGTAAAAQQAPFGDKVGPAFTNYNRAAPTVGSAGELGEGAIAQAKALGFKTIVNLRTAKEGEAAEEKAVEAAGLDYVNIPVTTLAPTPEQVETFAKLVEDPARQPMLVHCSSANRVGAIWALYRARQGVSPEVAVQEGVTLNLHGTRLDAVKTRLGLTAATQ